MNQEIYLSTEPRGGGYVRYDGMMNAYSPTIKKSTLITTTTPQVKQIIFNNPATIVYWQDGTKTVVKTMHGDTFNEEYGVAMAYMKKLFGGNGFKKMVAEYKSIKVVKEKSDSSDTKRKIGERVIIRNDLSFNQGHVWNERNVYVGMLQFRGKEATIIKCSEYSNECVYRLDIDAGIYGWRQSMLEPRNSKNRMR